MNHTPKLSDLEKYKKINNISVFKIAEFLSIVLKNYEQITLIDVGCAIGDFKRLLNHANIMSIGIDPLIEDYKKYSHNILNSYTFIYDCVIDIDEKDKLFYVTSAKDCSSLYKFNEKITNDETNTIDFYLPENRMKDSCTVIDKRIVGSKTLENIFDLHKIEVLHILKVDAQGNDLNVIKSAEKYLDRILFIVMESNSEDTTTLYKDSTTFHEDHTYLISHNFKLLGKEVLLRDDYDCIYYNAKLIIN